MISFKTRIVVLLGLATFTDEREGKRVREGAGGNLRVGERMGGGRRVRVRGRTGRMSLPHLGNVSARISARCSIVPATFKEVTEAHYLHVQLVPCMTCKPAIYVVGNPSNGQSTVI
jgi:hypothetical protein